MAASAARESNRRCALKAKEYFEGIRAEVVKVEQAREMLEKLKAREGAKAQSYQAGGGSGDASNPMDAILRRIDFEGRLSERVKESSRSVDDACAILYGPDGKGGLAKLKGTRYADAVCMFYLQAETWADMAEVMCCSPQWCQELCRAAFVYIDRVGWAKVRNA